MTNWIKLPIIYKDEHIEIKINKDMDINDMPQVAMSCIESGLIWFKTYCMCAKDPTELWKYCKKDILEAVKVLEEILSDIQKDEPK